MLPPSFPPAVPYSGIPFAPQGPFGSVPLLHRYCEILRGLHALPPRLLLRPKVPLRVPCSFQGAWNATSPWPGLFLLRCPQPHFAYGNVETSQVPGEPPCAHALLFDHGGTFRLGHSSAFRCCLALSGRRRLPQLSFRGSITRPVHFLSTLCGRGSPLRHTRLGSGGWPALPDRRDYLLGSITRFQLLVSCFLLVQACLAHPDPCVFAIQPEPLSSRIVRHHWMSYSLTASAVRIPVSAMYFLIQ